MRKATFNLLAALVFTAGTAVPEAVAQTPGTEPELAVAVSVAQGVFRVDEPLNMSVSLVNGGGDFYPTRGFMGSAFHLRLTFIGPDGAPIRARETGPLPTPPPPLVRYVVVDPLQPPEPLQVDPVEFVAAGWAGGAGTFNAHDWYDLTKAGLYSVRAEIDARTYPAAAVIAGADGGPVARIGSSDWEGRLVSEEVFFTLAADADGDGYSTPVGLNPPWQSLPDCDDSNAAVNPGASEIIGDGKDDDCNAATPDQPGIPPGVVMVQADLHTVGTGSHPVASKTAIPGMKLKVYDSASPCVRSLGTSWKSHQSIWGSCTYIPLGPPPGVPATDQLGSAALELPPGNYYLLGEYEDPAAPATKLYLGRGIDRLVSGETRKQYLQVIVKADGKKVPAKYTVKTGSELLIIEPEYIEWSGTQELYPFVFASVGDWTVSTAVSPPAGFVADKKSLNRLVNSELGALQFTITDAGGTWMDTAVTYTVTHKGRTQTVKSKVGVKLTKRLAERKKLTQYGMPLPGGRR